MAASSFQELVTNAAGRPKALAQLAIALLAKGQEAPARDLAGRALNLAPDDAEVRSLVARVFNYGIPHWHFALPFDRTRNAAYDASIRRAVHSGSRVLEIGAGTGLLAMMAARAGASRVVTCEAVPAIAAVATEIVARNGYSDVIRVVAKHSDDLDVEQDLGGPADILVSEIMANDIVGELALPSIERAKRRLLTPDARIIPARSIVRVALAEDVEEPSERMSAVEGFDLSPFNRLAAHRYRVRVNSARLLLRSEPVDLFSFDFQSQTSFPEAHGDVTVTGLGGRVNCIAQWLRCEMDEAGSFENSPRSGDSSWALDVYPLLRPIDTAPGQSVKIFGAHDRKTLRVWSNT